MKAIITIVSAALVEDRDIERTTLKLRDAFRILAWQYFRPHLKQTHLHDCYTMFMTHWTHGSIRSMDLTQLTSLAKEKNLSVENLLRCREIYYGLGALSDFENLGE